MGTECYLDLKILTFEDVRHTLSPAWDRISQDFYYLTKTCFGSDLSFEELSSHFLDVDALAVAYDRGALVGVSTMLCFNIPNRDEKAAYVSGALTHPRFQRIGLGSRLTCAVFCAAFPGAYGEIFRMQNSVIPFVTRTQNIAVYKMFSKWFKGVSKQGEKPAPRYQFIINHVAEQMGWVLDENNIQRGAYEKQMAPHLIPSLNEHDAQVFCGDYTWKIGLLSRFAFRVYYPVQYYFNKKKRKIWSKDWGQSFDLEK
ncbi:hypothetical protein ACFL9T_06835 [Thermodesulfobacteriota bacterium]